MPKLTLPNVKLKPYTLSIITVLALCFALLPANGLAVGTADAPDFVVTDLNGDGLLARAEVEDAMGDRPWGGRYVVKIAEGFTGFYRPYPSYQACFNNCDWLVGIVFPSTMKTIENACFYDCNNLEWVTLPEGLTEIGPDAFEDCTALTAVTVPNSVTDVGEGAFSRCTKLSNVTLGSGLKKISTWMFRGNTALASITIPASVTDIDYGAFYLSGLSSVTLPAGLKTIGESAFEETKTLSAVNLPEGLTTIGGAAFRGSGLTKVTVPGSVAKVSRSAFSAIDALTSVEIKEGVKVIDEKAFYTSPALVSVIFPKSVTSVDSWAFASSPKLSAVSLYAGTAPEDYFKSSTGVKVTYLDIPTRVKLSKGKITIKLKKNKSVTLSQIVYADKTALPLVKVTWSSSNKKIAKVNQSGKVTALKPGKVQIIAKTKNGKKAVCTITVKKK